jgi:hypothetical protein
MDLSDQLARLNFNRYADWTQPFTPENAKQSLLAFDGDVYDGLAAKTLSAADLDFAQQHVRILSGLYGILRPLDLIQPYRLEMGTKFANAGGKDLYAFWGETLLTALNAELAAMPRPVFQGGGRSQVARRGDPAGVRGLERRPLPDRQLLRQARAGADDALRGGEPPRRAGRVAGLRRRRLRLRGGGIGREVVGFPPAAELGSFL